jgi:hypothetical protein
MISSSHWPLVVDRSRETNHERHEVAGPCHLRAAFFFAPFFLVLAPGDFFFAFDFAAFFVVAMVILSIEGSTPAGRKSPGEAPARGSAHGPLPPPCCSCHCNFYISRPEKATAIV